MSFTITIKNNENGEVLVNEKNAVAIIGAFESDDGHTGEIAFCSCGTLKIVSAIMAAKKAINRVISADEKIAFVAKIAEEITEEKEAKGKNE